MDEKLAGDGGGTSAYALADVRTSRPEVLKGAEVSGPGSGQHRDTNAGRRDDVADERDVEGEHRDTDAELRDDVADERDVEGEHRDTDAGLRDDVAAGRDLSGERRDSEGGRRDRAAEERDRTADERDAEAEQRDRQADQRDRDAELSESAPERTRIGTTTGRQTPGVYRQRAASDRELAREDRRAGAAYRRGAASDRGRALADRVAGAGWRDLSSLDRGTALADRGIALADRLAGAGRRSSSGLDRGTALADRIAGASRRSSAGLDRGTALDDRAASAVDRRSAAEFAALELRIADSEARAWRLLQAVPDPVVVVDAGGSIELINAQALLLFGYGPDELIGVPVERLVPTGLQSAHRAHRTAFVATDDPSPMSTGPNIVAVRKDGSTVPVAVNLSAITLSTGPAVLVRLRDVSERKAVDAELRISDERFRVSFDIAPIGMALIDLRPDGVGRFLRVNRALCELTGYTQDALLATTTMAITDVEDRERTAENLDRLADGSATRWDTDKRYNTVYGDDVWVHFSIAVVQDVAGRPSYGVSQVEDVTDRRQAEAQMAERFRELATNVDVGFLLRQIDSPEFLYFNPAYLTVFGFDQTGPPPTAENSLALIHPDDRDRASTILGRVPVGERVEQEWRLTRPDGELRWISARVSPIADGDRGIRRVAGIFEDITDRKLAEDAVLAARAEADRANVAKDDFLSRMSHELRTPLNAVLGFAQLLELDPLSRSQDDAVGHILRGGRHLLAMIDDVLDITGIEADRLEISPESVDIAELVKDALGLMQILAAANQIVMRFDETSPAAGLCVFADRRRLKQVLLNLLSNAIKYNRPGGTVDVDLSVNDDDEVCIAVIDNGMGIAAVDLPRLFNPFDRLGQQSSDIEGTGIGLVLSKRLTNLMGGRLDVETAEGQGSTFTVTMPFAAPPKYTDLVAGGRGGTRPAERKIVSTLIYIEDNTSNVNLLTEILRWRPGWTMWQASSGGAGLELAETATPTAILLDLHLPDIDGIDVLRALKANPATSFIPVAILSADASPGQVERLLAAGASQYLTKPLDLGDVFAFLDSHAL